MASEPSHDRRGEECDLTRRMDAAIARSVSASMEDLERELKDFIVESLMLEDVRAEDIESDAPLFVEGLGLDSIDALELGMALTRKYGVRIKAEDDRNREFFRSVSSLAAFIKGHRKEERSPA